MSRTNVVLNDKLVKEAFGYADVKTKKALIDLALEEFVKNKRRLNLFDLQGEIRFAPNYDYKKLRKGA
jgi:Arc/MetJ family transcription regulator